MNRSRLSAHDAARDEWAEITIAANKRGAYDLICKHSPRPGASTKEIRQAIDNVRAELATRDQPIQTYALPTD